METENKIKYDVYLNVICFVARYITPNLKRLYLDVNRKNELAQITAFYSKKPTELELELLDDIETNSISRSPNIIFEQSNWKLISDLKEDENKRHDFLLFSFYEGHKD
jgi:hypothetical protein